MKALHADRAFLRDYNLKSWAPNFEQGQPGRINQCRMFIETMLYQMPQRPLRIVELGCGSGDISGPYSGSGPYSQKLYYGPRGMIDTKGIEVIGVDLMPDAQRQFEARFPDATFMLAEVEDLEPIECDILVLCEFLEHIEDPITLAQAWMAKASWTMIGHPLDEPDPPFEKGHAWSYNMTDWIEWFNRANYALAERVNFRMGPYEMVLGYGRRL